VSDGPEWFAPKRFGIGSGLPIAWQGWVVLLVYAGLIALAVAMFGKHSLAGASIVLPATAVLIFICLKTTRGGWRWRSGGDD
jgi:hypothetical protein